jgi:hypothetical protein
MKYYAVFSGQSELPCVRFLKSGFKHCYALMHDGRVWVTVDPLSHYTEVTVHHHLPPEFDLPAWLETHGLTVVPVRYVPAVPKSLPWRVYTCVELVKRVLCIRHPYVFTPWQLYRHLTTQHQYKGVSPMGALIKSPKPSSPVELTPIVSTPPAPIPEPVPSDEEIRHKNREENLLRRLRGTWGTVVTGFRGVLGLSPDASAAPRKNLLGE